VWHIEVIPSLQVQETTPNQKEHRCYFTRPPSYYSKVATLLKNY